MNTDQRAAAERAAYHAAARAAPDCAHELAGGDLVRPWCGTPACPLCRRLHPVRWRRLTAEQLTAPSSAPVRTRALF